MNKGRPDTTQKTLPTAPQMKQIRIVPEMSFVLGNPPEPDRDVAQTIEFIRTVKRVNPATEIILYTYTPVPLAGELYEQAKAEGFAFPETLDEWISAEWADFSQRRSAHLPWLRDPVRRKLRDFQWVINAYYPTLTDSSLSTWKRVTLRALSAWRYHLRVYAHPIELRAAHKFLAYQRPETSGF